LEAFGLPLEVPDVDHDDLIELMYRDKKVERGRLRFVLPSRFGHVELVSGVANEDIGAVLKEGANA
jgi:3-dehydroquinate synthase